MENVNGYELSRRFFNWSFENPEKIKPLHTAIYFFAVEHCNRLGWKQKFGFPSQMVMEAIGIRNWRTYIKGLNDLVDFGFIEIIEKSTNQYSSNIIAIVFTTKAPTKAPTKALDKALSKHSAKQGQSTVSIDKQLNKEQRTIEQEEEKPKIDKFQFLTLWNKSRVHFGVVKDSNANMFPYQSINDLKDLSAVYDIEDFRKALSGLMKQQGGISKGLKSNIKHFLQPDHFERYLDAYNNKNFSLYDSEEKQGTKISI